MEKTKNTIFTEGRGVGGNLGFPEREGS